jgi:hypothetical protein
MKLKREEEERRREHKRTKEEGKNKESDKCRNKTNKESDKEKEETSAKLFWRFVLVHTLVSMPTRTTIVLFSALPRDSIHCLAKREAEKERERKESNVTECLRTKMKRMR